MHLCAHRYCMYTLRLVDCMSRGWHWQSICMIKISMHDKIFLQGTYKHKSDQQMCFDAGLVFMISHTLSSCPKPETHCNKLPYSGKFSMTQTLAVLEDGSCTAIGIIIVGMAMAMWCTWTWLQCYTHVQTSCPFLQIIHFKIRSFKTLYCYFQLVVVVTVAYMCTSY